MKIKRQYKLNTLINKGERECYFKYFVNKICHCSKMGVFPVGNLSAVA